MAGTISTRGVGSVLMDMMFGNALSVPMADEMPPRMPAPDPVMSAMEAQARAWNLNPFDPSTSLYGQEPTGLTSEEARTIARMSLIAGLINTRVRKWKACGHRQQGRGMVGYVVGTRDPRARNTKATQRKIEEIINVLERGTPFAIKMEKWSRDSHEIDRAIGQVLFNDDGIPEAITTEDGARFRWAIPTQADFNRGRVTADTRPVVQWVNGRPVEAFARQQIVWIQRNNRTDIDIQGYGYSEMEMASSVIDSLWKADSFNTRFFENGVHAPFILKFKAQMSPETWESLQRQITDRLKGVRNAHKFAAILLRNGQAGITQPEDVDVVNLGATSPKDMEFRWAYSFYYRVLAAIMGIDLEEAGLSDPADTGRSTLQEANTEWKLLQSHASGLMPGLQAVQMELNTRVVWPIDPDFSLRFEGLSSMSPREQADYDEQRGRFLSPYNEVRVSMDMEPIKWTYEKPEDECPIAYTQLYTMMRQMKLQEEQQKHEQEMQRQQMQGQQQPEDKEPSVYDFPETEPEEEEVDEGPFPGPRGGLYANPEHTMPWRPDGPDGNPAAGGGGRVAAMTQEEMQSGAVGGRGLTSPKNPGMEPRRPKGT